MILYAIPVSTYSAKVRIALGIKNIVVRQVTDESRRATMQWMGAG